MHAVNNPGLWTSLKLQRSLSTEEWFSDSQSLDVTDVTFRCNWNTNESSQRDCVDTRSRPAVNALLVCIHCPHISFAFLPGICLEAYHWGLQPPHMPPAVLTGALPSQRCQRHTNTHTETHMKRKHIEISWNHCIHLSAFMKFSWLFVLKQLVLEAILQI